MIVHYKLDLQICLHIPDTAFHRHHILSFAERRPVKSGKRQGYFADLFLSSPDRHPVDHRKGIVEKMRIDLGLKRFQFKFLQGDFIYIHLVDQTVDLIHHSAEAPDQDSHLVLRAAGYCDLPASMIYPVNVSGKLFYLSGKKLGEDQTKEKNDQHAENDQRNLFQRKPQNRS